MGMRAHKTFTRQKSGASNDPLLGSDALDPNTPTIPSNADTVMACRAQAISGYATRRVAVFYSSSNGAAPVLQARAWFFEQVTQRWYALEAAKGLTVNTGTFFDMPTPSDAQDVAGGTTSHCYLQVSDNAGGAGTYTFAMVPTLS